MSLSRPDEVPAGVDGELWVRGYSLMQGLHRREREDVFGYGLVLPALQGFTAGKPVFLVGDLTQRGTPYEAGIVSGVARLGTPVVAVSGNHDSRSLMRAVARQGSSGARWSRRLQEQPAQQDQAPETRCYRSSSMGHRQGFFH